MSKKSLTLPISQIGHKKWQANRAICNTNNTSLPVGMCFASFTLAKFPLPIVLRSRYFPMWGSSPVRRLEIRQGVVTNSFHSVSFLQSRIIIKKCVSFFLPTTKGCVSCFFNGLLGTWLQCTPDCVHVSLIVLAKKNSSVWDWEQGVAGRVQYNLPIRGHLIVPPAGKSMTFSTKNGQTKLH